VSDATFLPFDVYSFLYPTVPGYSFVDQENAFQGLNAQVLWSLPTPAIAQLIDGWYAGTGGVFNLSATPDRNFIPSGWTTEPDLYENVMEPYCQTCHFAQIPAKDWATAAEFKAAAIGAFVCSAKIMPHAEVPFDKFWTSGARAHLLNQVPIASACN